MSTNDIKILYFNLATKNFPIKVHINGDPNLFEIRVIYM